MKQQNGKKKFSSLVLTGVIVVGCLISMSIAFFVVKQGVNLFLLSFMDTEPEALPRQIQATDELNFNWQRTLISRWLWIEDSPNNESIFMIIKDNHLILPVWNIEDAFTANISLNSYEVETGELNWQTVLDVNSTFSIRKNSDTIFILATDVAETRNFCDPDFRCSAFTISAYDIKSGEIIWEVSPEELFYNNSGLLVDISDKRFYLISKDIDPQPPITVCLDANSGNRAFDCEDSESAFSTENPSFGSIPEEFEYNPQNIVSNFAQNSDFSFFMTAKDQSLWVINKESFEKVASVKFEGSPIKKGNHYHIAANEETVVVYMADSHQLIAFDLP